MECFFTLLFFSFILLFENQFFTQSPSSQLDNCTLCYITIFNLNSKGYIALCVKYLIVLYRYEKYSPKIQKTFSAH